MSIRCPRCGSSYISKHNKHRSTLNDSAKGAVIGGLAGSILPGIGTVAGAVVGGLSGLASNFLDNNKEDYILLYRCRSCGNFWSDDDETAFTNIDKTKNNSNSGIKERLKELKELKEEGFITDEEYETKKKEILKDM